MNQKFTSSEWYCKYTAQYQTFRGTVLQHWAYWECPNLPSSNGWVNNCEDSDLRRHRPHHDVTGMGIRQCVATHRGLRYPRMRHWLSSYLSPVRRQVITKTDIDILSIGPTGTNFGASWTKIGEESYKNTPVHDDATFSALLAFCAGNSPETPVIWDAIALIMTSL